MFSIWNALRLHSEHFSWANQSRWWTCNSCTLKKVHLIYHDSWQRILLAVCCYFPITWNILQNAFREHDVDIISVIKEHLMMFRIIWSCSMWDVLAFSVCSHYIIEHRAFIFQISQWIKVRGPEWCSPTLILKHSLKHLSDYMDNKISLLSQVKTGNTIYRLYVKYLM